MTLAPLTSDLLADVSHGFFTRIGGNSTGIYSGLNCGRGSDDRPEAVQSNRTAVADFFGQPFDHLQSVHQIHSPQVQILTAPLTDAAKADAMVTATSGTDSGGTHGRLPASVVPRRQGRRHRRCPCGPQGRQIGCVAKYPCGDGRSWRPATRYLCGHRPLHQSKGL